MHKLHDTKTIRQSRDFFVEIFPSVSFKRVPTEIVTSFVEFFSDSIDSAEKLANLTERKRKRERERRITTLSDVFFQSLI